MKRDGVSLISLIVTIIIVILLAGMLIYYATDSVGKANQMDLKDEISNVEEVVSRQGVRLMIGDFTPNDVYLATSNELSTLKGKVDSDEDKTLMDRVISINSNPGIDNINKYYLMDQDAFNNEFEEDVNVNNIKRMYLINYGTGDVITVYKGKTYTNTGVSTQDPVSAVTISFSPDGNAEWSTYQATIVTVQLPNGKSLAATKPLRYIWSQGLSAPTNEEWNAASVGEFVSGSTLRLESKTGNDWYLWICVKDSENEQTIKRSRSFYIDNTAPEATMTLE